MLKTLSLALAAVISAGMLSLYGCSSDAGPGTVSAPKGEPIRVGYMICNSRSETEARFKPLTAYLSARLGKNFVPVYIDTVEFEKAVRENKVEFTHTNSLVYVMMNKYFGVEPLAGDAQGRNGHRTNGGIIVTADSSINSIADLRGKRMVFGPMLAPTGYLSQYDLLLKNGIDPESDLAPWKILGGSFIHEKLVYSLMFGAFDAAFVPMLDFEKMSTEGKIDPSQFRILAETEPIPYCTFGVTEQVDDALAESFRDAVLSITPEDTVEIDGERVKVLKAAGLDGFDPVTDSEYDSVREMARNCNMPPYQKF